MPKEIKDKDSPFKEPWYGHTCGRPPVPLITDGVMEAIGTSLRVDRNTWKNTPPEQFTQYWKERLLQKRAKEGYVGKDISCVVDEVAWYNDLEREWLGNKYCIGKVDLIIYSDTAINPDMPMKLKEAVYPLYTEPLQRFTPPENLFPGRERHLFHPSMFPLTYGVSIYKELKQPIYFVRAGVERKGIWNAGLITSHQYLPSTFDYDEQSKSFKITSYINNLHPIKYKGLYDLIETVFNESVVGLNYVLSRASSEPYTRLEQPYKEEFYEALKKTKTREERQKVFNSRDQWVNDTTPKWKGTPHTNKIDLARDFGKCKVIVLLIDHEILPNSEYPGNAYDLYSLINEDVVATIIYYFDMQNISSPALTFAQSYSTPIARKGDEAWLLEEYGMKEGSSLMLNVDRLDAKNGRVVIFPNKHPYAYPNAWLLDPNTVGYCSALIFQIVDPYNSFVKTTADVVPQQLDWYKDPSLAYLFPDDLGKFYKPQSLHMAADDRLYNEIERAKHSNALLGLHNTVGPLEDI